MLSFFHLIFTTVKHNFKLFLQQYTNCSKNDTKRNFEAFMTLNSLTWFDLIPIFGVVVAIATIILKAGMKLQELKEFGRRITVLETKLAEIEKNLHNQKAIMVWGKTSVKIRRQRLK